MKECLILQYQVTRVNTQVEATEKLNNQTRSDNGSRPAK